MLPKTPEHKSGIDLEARVGLAGFELGSGERQPPILDPTILPGDIANTMKCAKRTEVKR